MRKSACSATEEEFAVPANQRNSAAGECGHVDGVIPDPYAGDDLQSTRERALRLAKARQPKDRAMYFAARPQQRVKFGRRESGGKRYNLDIVARIKQPSAARAHDAGHQYPLSVGRQARPPTEERNRTPNTRITRRARGQVRRARRAQAGKCSLFIGPAKLPVRSRRSSSGFGPFAGAFRGRKPRRLIAPGSIRRTRAGTVKCSSSATTRMGDFLHFLCEVGASISDLRLARPSSLSARDGISRMSLELSPMASEKPNCRAGAPHRSRGRAAPRGDKPVGTPGCGHHCLDF